MTNLLDRMNAIGLAPSPLEAANDAPAAPRADMTREAWLKRAESIMARWIEIEGYSYPAHTRVSCGFPKSFKGRGRAIGQCWSRQVSADEHFEMFICPTLSDGVDVCGVLIHEMTHATVGIENGHNKVFGKLARALGMEGKLTATTVGDDLRELIVNQVIAVIGDYPHAAMTVSAPDKTKAPKRAKTYLIKCECDTCGHVSYSTAKWIGAALEEGGAMRCPNSACDGTLNAASGE